MEIIHELEKSPRGIYGGAVGYIDFAGNMDMCIGIRMAVAKQGKVFVRSGGGIVKDSIPENEYQETINKAQSMIEAITKAQEVETYDLLVDNYDSFVYNLYQLIGSINPEIKVIRNDELNIEQIKN